jgi:4-amino-4-deoxy-L-arabinose transferase-like glycosyltransferase
LHSRLALALLLVALAALYLATLRPGHAWDDDFALYVAHARNLATGVAYEQTGFLHRPWSAGYSPPSYPPVFPALLAPAYALFGLSLVAMKAELVLIFLLCLAACFALFSSSMPSRAALLGVALLGFNFQFWDYKDRIMSDVPFLLFCSLSLYLAQRADGEPLRGRRLATAALCGLTTYLAYGTRTAGVALIGALVAYELARYRRPTLVGVSVIAVFLVLRMLQSALLPPSEGGYTSQVVRSSVSTVQIGQELLYNARTSLPALIQRLSLLTDNGYVPAARVLLFVLASGCAAVGFVTRLRHSPSVLEAFPLAYLPLIVFFPSGGSIRMLFPLVPLYLLYVLVGVQVVLGRIPARTGSFVALALLLAIAGSYAAKYASQAPVTDALNVEGTDSVALFAFLRTRTEPASVVVSRRPRAVTLYSQRSGAMYPGPEEPFGLWDSLREVRADYLVVTELFPDDQQILVPLVQAHPERFSEVYRNPSFRVYRISRDCPGCG